MPGGRIFVEPREFEWDSNNAGKIWKKHRVLPQECEEAFSQKLLLVVDDFAHSTSEARHLALGCTHSGRRLFVVFTIRGTRVRVISAREMSRRERRSYEAAETEGGSEVS